MFYLKIIRDLLLEKVNDIDSGNSNITEQDSIELINTLLKFSCNFLSKVQAYNYIGVSRATFNNYIKRGLIPDGIKKQGFNEKFWLKSDLDNFLNVNKN